MIAYSKRVTSSGGDHCRVHVLPTTAYDIVTFRGSFLTLPDMRSDEDLIQDLVVATLDKGTRLRNKQEISEQLDNLGAQISFYSDGLRAGFSGRSLTKDVEAVMALVAEQLREPLLDAGEVEKARTRLIASAQRSLESTSDQASGALRRSIFAPDHPNYSMSPAQVMRRYKEIGIDEVRSYHAAHFGARDFNSVFVGDIKSAPVDRVVSSVFESWTTPKAEGSYGQSALTPAAGLSFISMPDKPNADVSMGHGLDLRRDDPRFIPFYVANYVLGGNFSARLMSKVRDELGLTYGIRSGIQDVDVDYDGLWEVSVTLSTENLDRGIDATRREVEAFVASGITEAELEEKKTTLTGSFKVGLSTTAGLARTLLSNIERGFGPGYMDRFPEEVMECTLAAANAAVRDLLNPREMHVSVAGARSPELVSQGA